MLYMKIQPKKFLLLDGRGSNSGELLIVVVGCFNQNVVDFFVDHNSKTNF